LSEWEDRGGRTSKGRMYIREEFAYILDFMPQGNPFDKHPEHRRTPIAQAIGDKYFTLMELVTRENEYFEVGERIYVGYDYIGKGPIKAIVAPIDYEDLTNLAKQNLKAIVTQIVKSKEEVFIQIFNYAEPITLKMHTLELIPGIGKKSLQAIIDERRMGYFKSFKDLEDRLAMKGVKIGDVASMVAERIVKELMGGERYYLFIKPKTEELGVKYLGFLEAIYKELEKTGGK
jgi:putative nucleotide binding protein